MNPVMKYNLAMGNVTVGGLLWSMHIRLAMVGIHDNVDAVQSLFGVQVAI